MLLFFEAVFLHGLIAMTLIYQGTYEFSTYLISPSLRTDDEQIKHDVQQRVNEYTSDKPLWGLPSGLVVQLELEIPYEVSVLSEDQDAFFNELSNSVFLSVSDDKENVDDCILTMDSWTNETEPVSVTRTLSATANATIKEHKLGEQLWVVEVIGEEAGYLHVSDGGGRAWINSKGFGLFSRKDILSVLVDRKTDLRVNLIDVEMLQEHSTEFSMVDDLVSYDLSEHVEYVSA